MTKTIKIKLPDENLIEFEQGVSGFEIAKKISNSLAKEAIAIKINGEIFDLSKNDCVIQSFL